jgi:hypothetical protein
MNPWHPHSDSDPFCAAPPNPCPASVLVCLAQITSAVAVQLLYALQEMKDPYLDLIEKNYDLEMEIEEVLEMY